MSIAKKKEEKAFVEILGSQGYIGGEKKKSPSQGACSKMG